MITDFEIIHPEQLTTSVWTGGKTTQLAISPKEAVYSKQDFLWRVSSATVESDTSNFTELKDYNRIISVIHNSMKLSHGDKTDSIDISPLQFYTFDGGIPTQSVGQCTDFNIMLKKDSVDCNCQSFCLSAMDTIQFCISPTASNFKNCTVIFYIVQGEVNITSNNLTKLSTQGSVCLLDIDNSANITAGTGSQAAKFFYVAVRY